jgi:hypothetical protein
MQSKGQETQALKRFPNTLITLPKEPGSFAHPKALAHHLALCLTNLAVASSNQPPMPAVPTRLHRQGLRVNFLHASALQAQHPVAPARERQIVRGNEGGELVLAM